MRLVFIVEMEVHDQKSAEEAAFYLNRDVKLTMGPGVKTRWYVGKTPPRPLPPAGSSYVLKRDELPPFIKEPTTRVDL